MKNRRSFIQQSLLGIGGIMLTPTLLQSEPHSGLKIVRIKHYVDPNYSKPTFAQKRDIVVIETDGGIAGIGEGGSRDLIENCAGQLIGEDPFRIEHLWQKMYRGYFYPSGRERLHAMGGLDMALWDLKAKALEVPVYELLGGLTRDYVSCYSTNFPDHGSIKETAQACIDAGFYAFRLSTGGPRHFDAHKQLDANYEKCREASEGVGEKGAWCVDFHTRFDPPEAVTLANTIEPLKPVFVEDLIRSENPEVYRTLREKVNVPIAVGEQFGDRWDINMLIENHLIDHSRVTIPNTGGITEFMKIAALCETHYVGLIPHNTGPIAGAALIHSLLACSGFAMAENVRDTKRAAPYLNDDYVIFRDGKYWPNNRPGLGVELDTDKVKFIGEYSEPGPSHPMYHRSDGSITNW